VIAMTNLERPRSSTWRVAPVLAGLAAAALLNACGSPSTTPTASGSTVSRTPQYSVSSTFSLPSAPALPADGSGGTSATPSATPNALPSERPLAGKVIVIDPGHNGGNAAHPGAINRKVDAGGFLKECDTTGTETDAGYPEHAFTLDVAQRTADILRYRGATVDLTRDSDTGVGPCVDQRAAIGNQAGADAAVSVHADGGPATGKGFHVIRPGLLPGRNDAVVGPSESLAESIHTAMLGTGEPVSTYVGSNGYDVRTDLGGLNLSTVPKVFVECANMRNADDAARLTDPGFRQKLAQALADGLQDYLFGR
jgi:N-acetylmuramoyl-L-alanine amidase